MIIFQSYDTGEDISKEHYNIPDKVENISISYDGGRLHVWIGNEEVLSTMMAGNDFNVTIN